VRAPESPGTIRNPDQGELTERQDDNIAVPIMVIEPGTEEPIHLFGYTRDADKQAITACGRECGHWNTILSFEPTCIECILVQRA
jgi:hypothetical protein